LAGAIFTLTGMGYIIPFLLAHLSLAFLSKIEAGGDYLSAFGQ
jgi:hypothetical protein